MAKRGKHYAMDLARCMQQDAGYCVPREEGKPYDIPWL